MKIFDSTRATCSSGPLRANPPVSETRRYATRRPRARWYVWVVLFLFYPPALASGAVLGVAQTHAAISNSPVRTQQKEKKKEKKEKKKPAEEKPAKGTLGEFEKEATGDKKKDASPKASYSDSDDDGGWENVIGAVFFEATKIVFLYGGAASWHRVHGVSLRDAPADDEYGEPITQNVPRRVGEPMIPYLGLNTGYQRVESDVNAASARLEAGYGPAALHFDWTHYKEIDPDAELDLIKWHGLYRMSFTQFVEVDAGLGSMTIRGDDSRSGLSMTFPVQIQISRFVGLVFNPAWGWINKNTISDVELALSVGIPFVYIHGGYRWVKAGASSLNGPVMGLSFYL